MRRDRLVHGALSMKIVVLGTHSSNMRPPNETPRPPVFYSRPLFFSPFRRIDCGSRHVCRGGDTLSDHHRKSMAFFSAQSTLNFAFLPLKKLSFCESRFYARDWNL
jgi:hypothetical protein